jgi:hypothetical protein
VSDDIYFMMRGEGHAYWTMQNRLMSELAKANQTIGMLKEQIDQIQSERDEARLEVCECKSQLKGRDFTPMQIAEQRGWRDIFDALEETAREMYKGGD